MPPARIAYPREPHLAARSGAAPSVKDVGGFGLGFGGLGLGGFGLLPGSTGQAVSPVASLGIATAWACVKRLAEDNGKLPRKIMRRLPHGGSVEVRDHPLSRVLRAPNPWQTPSQCWGYLTTWLALRGNAYAAVARGRGGEPVALIPLNNDRTSLLMSATSGELYYEVGHPFFGIGTMRLHRDNVLHVRNAISLDGYTGVSPIAAAPDVFGLGIATQQHGAVLFRQGAQLNGILKHPGKLNPEAKDYLSRRFSERLGGVQNAHSTPVLDEGMTFEKVTMTNEDAQFLESRQFSVPEICFTPETLILTSTGPKCIDTIIVGEMVLTHKGRWRAVTNVSRTTYVGMMLTVRAKGLEAVTVTPGHPFLVQTAKPNREHKIGLTGSPAWVAAGSLKPAPRNANGDRARGEFQNLVMPKIAVSVGMVVDLATWAPEGSVISERTLVSSVRANPTPVTRFVPANGDLGWICGLFAAEGSTSDHQTVFYTGANETAVHARLESLLRTTFGVNCRTTIVGSVARTVATSRIVAAFFRQFGRASHEVRLPAWCLAESNSAGFRQGLLAGLVDGNGHVAGRGNVTTVRTTSYALVWQIRLLVWASGLYASICSVAAGTWEINGRSGPSLEIWNVSWREQPERRGGMADAGDLVCFSMDEVEDHQYAGPVYNLEVDEDESYTTVGGTVHNCRMFGVPPHKVHDLTNAHFSTVEQNNLQYWSDTLQPIGKQYEEECSRVLLFDDEQDDLSICIDYDELMRADRKTRYETDEIGIRSGRLSQNEARISDGREPNVPNGDQFLTPLNMASSADKPDADTTADEKPEPASEDASE